MAAYKKTDLEFDAFGDYSIDMVSKFKCSGSLFCVLLRFAGLLLLSQTHKKSSRSIHFLRKNIDGMYINNLLSSLILFAFK
jgi:hypothetical protein